MKFLVCINIIICSFFISCGNNTLAKKQVDSAKKDSINTENVTTKNPFLQSQKTKEPQKTEIIETESETQKEFKKQLRSKIDEYKSKCDKKDGQYCFKLATTYDILQEKGDIEIKEIFEKGAQFLTIECEKGQMSACAALGTAFESGNGTIKDIKKAMELYQKSCDAKVASGCLNLGLLISKCSACEVDSNNAKDSKNQKEAMPFFIKACEYGSESACEIVQKNSKI